MAPSKKSRRSAKVDKVPDVYREMLAEADTSAQNETTTSEEGRAPKKRRIGGRVVIQSQLAREDDNPKRPTSADAEGMDESSDIFNEPTLKRQQTVKDDSDESSDSDANWEEVDLLPPSEHAGPQTPSSPEAEDLDLVLGPTKELSNSAQRAQRRLPITAAERRLRLEIHKMHVCCLLVHVHVRNHWCNHANVQSRLRKVLSPKTLSYLNPKESESQFQRSRSFMDGLEQASNSFRSRFQTNSRGLDRARWAERIPDLQHWQPPQDGELPIEREDFLYAARSLKASRDVGAQLFCALLRSAGVEARLVCSLQCLPFKSAPPPSNSQPRRYVAAYSADGVRNSPELDGSPSVTKGKGKSNPALDANARVSSEMRNNLRESKFPVFWVEAFNEAVQKWVSVDPLVTKTIAKPSKLEPPAGDTTNSLCYVVGFEENGCARDITRRYAKAYNAKTRKDRVESTKRGDKWWKRVMKMFRRNNDLDRDQLENSELASKEAAEPIPKNVQDFKDHPYYALERHLKRNEIIHPKREVGKVGAGKSGTSTDLESIFRRRDVLQVLSADKWYRMGREIKRGEQPLKQVPARKKRDTDLDVDERDEDDAGVGLYAPFQTSTYKAPPVVNGIIPKNMYGNLDIYVPTMVPLGGVHIEHLETSRAAKTLGIDFADAVTGFVFKGRHGTAVTRGAVVASEYREAILEVLEAFNNERIQEEENRKTGEALRLWKRFLTGLRIKERIQGYDIEGERDIKRPEVEEEEANFEDAGGGFFPDQGDEGIAKPTVGKHFNHVNMDTDEGTGGGFLPDESDGNDGNEDEVEDDDETGGSRRRDRFLDDFEKDTGSDFLVEDDFEEKKNASPRPTERTSILRSFSHDFGSDLLTTSLENPPLQRRRRDTKSPQPTTSSIPSRSMPQSSAKIRVREASPAFSASTDELEEARLLQELHDTRRLVSPPDGSRTSPKAATKPVANDEPLHPSSPRAPSAAPPDIITPPVPGTEGLQETSTLRDRRSHGGRSDNGEEPASETDKGSLLSADPDDEDADPDWLA